MATKTTESLELAIAQKGVCDYAADAARASKYCDNSAECERHVQQAIEAYRWISRAEESVRQGIYDGLIDFTPQIEQSMESLYREWLVSCEVTERTLANELEGGCIAPAASVFRDVASQAREKINSRAWIRKSRAVRGKAACESSES